MNKNIHVFDAIQALREYIQKGFSLESLSKVTNIAPERLKELLEEGYYDREKIAEKDYAYLNIFLSQLLDESPRDEDYLFELVNALTSYFLISHEAIANYLGIPASEFYNIVSKKDVVTIKQYAPEICHMFAVFMRDKRYSFMK